MAPQRRESTPDTPTSELRSRYLSVTKDANIDTKTAQHAMTMFETLQEKFNVEGDPVEWLLPGAYAYSISQKPSNVESKVVLWKLFKATSISVPVFFQRVKKWGEVAGLPGAARELFSRSERYFLMSKTIFGSFEQMYTCVFRDPLDADLLKNVTDRAMSLRKKQKVVFPKIVQSVDVYVFTWDLFVRCRLSAQALRDDLISCYHLLICVLDYVCANVLALKRDELLNPGCSIIPKVAEADEKTISTFSLIPYLCAKFEGISRDCQILYSNGFLPLLHQLIKDQELTTDGLGVTTGLLSPENFEKNVKSLNSIYENLVRITMAGDERVFLVSGDVNNPGVGGDPLNVMDVIETMKGRRKMLPSINRKLELNDFKTPTPVVSGLSISTSSTPLTPNSSCSVLERREQQESAKTPALLTAVDLVTQLTNLTAGRTTKPSTLLAELLKSVYEEDVSASFTKRAADYVEKLVKAYTEADDPKGLAEPYIRARFMFAQTWYFKILEDVLVSEKQRSAGTFTRMKRLIDAERFQKSMLALAVEMILYSYNCSRMFPWPIEALEVSPFDFVKVIEPVVRLEPLPRSITKHLARIEETIFEQLVWRSESPVWNEIAAEETRSVREVCWAHNLEETPTTGPRLPTTGEFFLFHACSTDEEMLAESNSCQLHPFELYIIS
ncbi:hypothetical protein RvY_07053-2 [Ramazzottius varieornatus]|uniref:Retinoblastoma-associated protein A-box domain-containing protein n=1 Tax=Ramazzottius varieornatus TaxID=947166 RepID=A0A1D1V406_RAMVA|nr:hypothetical protein RvY_07053-2 [Ramazzottius varieornatus]